MSGQNLFKWLLATGFLLSFIMETGMVTIPFAVTLAGFWPSIIAIILSCVYLLFTGFYYLEITLAHSPGANLYTFSKRYMGPGGALFSSTVFVLAGYGYLIYYLYLAPPILTEILFRIGISLSNEVCLLALALLLGGSVWIGLFWSAFLNFILVLLTFGLTFLCFYLGMESKTAVMELQWGFLFIVLPTIINSFYYNTLLPTIAPLLNYNAKQLKSAIVVAMCIGALLFIAWFWLAINSGSHSAQGLRKLNPESITFTSLYYAPLIGKWLPAILCLNVATTSLIIGSMMVDFICDFLNVPLEKRRSKVRFFACALAFIPPVALNLIPSKFIFLTALYITEIGPSYLNGLLPVICVWSLRYFYQKEICQMAPGGKSMVLAIGTLSCFVLYLVGLQIFYQISF